MSQTNNMLQELKNKIVNSIANKQQTNNIHKVINMRQVLQTNNILQELKNTRVNSIANKQQQTKCYKRSII